MSPPELPLYQQLFTAFLRAYLDNYVGPQPVFDGSLKRSQVHCGCADCADLNRFLADLTREVGRFAVNKERRHHLHQVLNSAGIDCTHETERVGVPQTLVVTKESRYFAQQFGGWTARRTQATKELVRFKQDSLRKLLGDEYTAIVDMDRILAARVQQPLAEAASQAGSSRQPAVGEKRKMPSDSEMDVIDLTSD